MRALDLGAHRSRWSLSSIASKSENLTAASSRLIFDTGRYFDALQVRALYPIVEITFQGQEGESHFHIPLLLSPNGYTTYRGSSSGTSVSPDGVDTVTSSIREWLNLLVRWFHVFAAIMWVGQTYYFTWLDGRLPNS